jgi:hypothetical protein
MKKQILLISTLILSIFSAFAQTQTAYDALIASSDELSGTARFMAVGGAMGALGGDASTIFYNPAGIGIYRSSELTVSANIHWDNTSMINSNSTSHGYNTRTNIDLQNVAYVGTWTFEENKNLLNFNLGIAYNQSERFEREGHYHGNQPHSYTQWVAAMTDNIPVGSLTEEFDHVNPAYYNSSIPWTSVIAFDSYLTDTKFNFRDDKYTSLYNWTNSSSVNQYIKFEELGSSNDFALAFGGNFNNLVYWGMTFECDYTTYCKNTTLQETFADGSKYTLNNMYSLEATGFTYKIGLIVKPTSWLRIGGAFHTPTAFVLKDYSTSTCAYNVYDIGGERRMGLNEVPAGEKGSARITGPLKAIGSLGFVLGHYGFIGIDYQYENTAGINGNENQIRDLYSNDLRDRHTIRAGIEVKPIGDLSLRIGGGYSTPGMNANMNRGYYYNDMRTDVDYYNETESYNITAGIGYRIGRHAIDLAYVYQVNTADYYPYAPSYTKYDGSLFQLNNFEPIGLRSVRNQLILTYNVRF